MRHLDLRPVRRPARHRSRGLSLIEIMVGVAIALVTTLVIFQVFANSNNTNRSTAAGNEAQISGAIGMFQLERDLKVAGMGFGTLTTMSLTGDPCMVQAINPALASPNFHFVPVEITPGPAAGAPDEINVLYGNSAFLTSGRTFVGASAGSTAISKLTQSGVGINPGDLAVLTNTANPPTTCELVEITGPPLLPVPRGNLIEHKQGAGSGYIDFTTGLPVPAATRNSAGTPAPMNISGGILYDLGARPALNRWSIVNNSLQFSNRLGDGAASTVAEGVVHLVAQYGIDDGAGGAVADDFIISPTEWRFAAPAAVPPVPANWSKVLAVRFALLARSPQFEKTAVSGNPTWSGGNFDMSAMPADWQHYRYRVYESTVAMRNMIWGTSP